MTDQLIGAKRDAENRLVGIVAESNQRKWNEHHAEKLLAAAKESPGKRIVMLVGIESRYEIMRLLKSNTSIQLVEVEDWLQKK
jgi:phosphoribosylanthranilate isomerase